VDVRDVCTTLARRRRGLYGLEEAAQAIGIPVSDLEALERGEGRIEHVDRLLSLLGVYVPLPKVAPVRRVVIYRGPGFCPRCGRKVGKVRGCGCPVGAVGALPPPVPGEGRSTPSAAFGEPTSTP